MPTAEGWQLSNAPILSMAAHKAALDVFEEAGMPRLHEKRKLLSDYLFYVIDICNADAKDNEATIITPRNVNEKGCQVSLLLKNEGRKIFEELTKAGVIADWREPNVIRIAPVPLYNSFEDIYRFGQLLKQQLS